MSDHSPFGPSALSRRLACPGSYNMEKGKPSEDNAYSAAGTRNHAAVTAILTSAAVSEDVDDEAWPAIHYCVDVARHAFKSANVDGATLIEIHEQKIDLTAIHPMVGFGTIDYAVVDPMRMGYVVDYKFTHINPPPVEQNVQLAAYAHGLMRQYELQGVHVVLTLANRREAPSCYWSEQALEAWATMIREHVDYAMLPFAPRKPSVSACRYCVAKPECPTLALASKDDGATVDELVNDLGALGEAAKRAKMSAAWSSAVLSQLNKVMYAGGDVPGWTMKPGRRMRDWMGAVDKPRLQELARDLGKPETDVVKEELASPAGLEKLWGKRKQVKDAMGKLIEYHDGKPSPVLIGDVEDGEI